MSIAKASLRLSGLFEAELLVELMLRYWKHPWAADSEYRAQLLESATEALRAAAAGQRLIENLPPRYMNLIAALWYVEWNGLSSNKEGRAAERRAREKWLGIVRRSLPACFCDPRLLD